jgi:hypothetical protein
VQGGSASRFEATRGEWKDRGREAGKRSSCEEAKHDKEETEDRTMKMKRKIVMMMMKM